MFYEPLEWNYSEVLRSKASGTFTPRRTGFKWKTLFTIIIMQLIVIRSKNNTFDKTSNSAIMKWLVASSRRFIIVLSSFLFCHKQFLF